MHKQLLPLLFLFVFACTSANENEKDSADKTLRNSADNIKTEEQSTGAPTKEEAQQILQNWFDSFKESVGGYSYDADNFEVLSVAGDAQQAEIHFQWTGTFSSAPLPDSDNSPSKVKNQKKTLLVEKRSGDWEVREVRG
ncbi:MAG TPA: hypothetical protein VM871_09100 [Flavisolibacter sp.]|nr:hypothetical protein [Flavisolibacter sp.]